LNESKCIEICVKGLLGGHSGMDIDSGRGNANKWLSRILWTLSQKMNVQLISFDGGGLRNAIPREASCLVSIRNNEYDSFSTIFETMTRTYKEEYHSIETQMDLSFKESNTSDDAVSSEDYTKIINTLCSVHNGVFRMSPDIDGLVETSSSLARVEIKNGTFITQSLQRSSVDTTRDEVAMAIKSSFENMNCEVVQSGEYPGWQPNPNSKILVIMEQLYKDMFKEDPQVKACHAGLECGILGKHLPGVDMISFGPNIRAAHSPDEKVQISSVQKFWKFYLETLNQIPVQ
jgi:dipeptidase D